MITRIIYWVYTVAAIVYAVFYMLAIDSIIESTKTFIIYTAILIAVLLIGMLIHHRFSSFTEWLEDKIKE